MMAGKSELDPQPERIGAKGKKLVSRRSVLTAAGSLAASLPFLEHFESKVEAAGESGPVTIAKQGSFFVGGTTITTPGTFDPAQTNGPGAVYYIDHMYAQYQIPLNPRQYPIVMLHGSGQTAKTWESTPDGRDGFQTIFLKRGFSVYLDDQPRRARAGFPSFNGPMGKLGDKQIVPDNTTRPSIQQGFVGWRLGPEYPTFYPNSAFPQANGGLEQFARQHINNVGDYNMQDVFPEVVSSAFVALLDKIGPAILMPHSMSGPYAMLTALKSPKVKAIYGYEPAAYVYPKGEPRPEILTSSGTPYRTDTYEVPLDEFMKLTKIPICIVYGDNIPTSPDSVAARDGRRCQVLAAKLFVEALKRHGGDATYVSLPDVGLHGNGHFMFFDTNNVQVGDLASKWLTQKGLDKRGPAKT
jgi:pimeloyl-ACP methyl ester carboxylesterase